MAVFSHPARPSTGGPFQGPFSLKSIFFIRLPLSPGQAIPAPALAFPWGGKNQAPVHSASRAVTPTKRTPYKNFLQNLPAMDLCSHSRKMFLRTLSSAKPVSFLRIPAYRWPRSRTIIEAFITITIPKRGRHQPMSPVELNRCNPRKSVVFP